MRKTLFGLALVALAAISAGAQQPEHGMHMKAGAGHDMKTPCPLHLDNLSLTTRQQASIDSLRADHETIMKSVMPSHDPKAGHAAMKHSTADKAVMESDMRLTVAAIRSVLGDTQRALFDAAVNAHATEMDAMKAKGEDACATCCAECEHEMQRTDMKHELMK